MDSLNYSSPPSTIFLCPKRRFLDLMEPDVNTYYSLFLDDRSLEESHHLVHLDWSKTKIDMFCDACKLKTITASDFWRDKCCVTYHKECVESQPQIKVPYHFKHPLQLRLPSMRTLLESSYDNKYCNCCGEDTKGFYYSCSRCDFNLHTLCAIKQNILSINYPKRHDHTLTYFPRKNSVTCDVCALGDDKCFIYICYQCDFVVHKPCIYLPTTIRISRHDHRLVFTSCLSIPNKDWSCGVCHERVDENYGQYSCVKNCNYVVQSKCATRRDLWDGKELEGEPEIEYENMKAFQEISDGIIEHFSHPNHYMRLQKKENHIVDDEKRCQACIFPIYEGNIYNCMKCDFILHETCAHLPRRKWHQLHAHPLTLQVVHKGGIFGCDAFFGCNACVTGCCGFAYTCCEPGCYFTLDVRCALVSEPFIHELHPHPLFLESEEGIYDECSICGIKNQHLTCSKCSFDLCFRCATVPNKVKYRYDEHFLTRLYDDEDATVYIYCEICEEATCPDEGFYKCNVCNVTLHIECLLGGNPFMKHGESIIIDQVTFLIIPNDRLTRPICRKCGKHSPYRIAFITLFGMLFCSTRCIYYFGEARLLKLDQQWRNGKDTLSKTENGNEL